MTDDDPTELDLVYDDLKRAQDRIERLEERCDAYKGQVEAGAAEIALLRKELGEAQAETVHTQDGLGALLHATEARIEQLEAALREIKDQYLTPDQSSAIAKAALNQKDSA
jgi:predicted RNase H-like nuclease (RuvC/YqgF family)